MTTPALAVAHLFAATKTTATLAAGKILAAPGGGPHLNTHGIQNFLLKNVVPILLAIIGIFILTRSRKGRISEVANTAVIAIIGIAFLVGSAAFVAFSRGIVNLTFG